VLQPVTTERALSRLTTILASVASLAYLAVMAAPSSAATVPVGFDDEFVGWVDYPTGLAPTPDGRMLITQQLGEVLVYDGASDSILATPALDLRSRVCTNIERGLVGVAIDPGFSDNHFVYLFYTYDRGMDACGVDPADPASQPVNRVSRFVLNGNTIDPATETVLLDNLITPTGNHIGGDLNFGKDGYLYVSVGDGGCDYNNDSGCGPFNNASRDPHVLLGKILRIDADGDVPADNPFMGANTARCGLTGRTLPGTWCQETFSWGLRNPFRFNMDPNAPGTRFFINDTGQDHWEEIDLGQAGADFGWNVREGRCATGSYDDCGPPPAGMTNPIFNYEHAVGCTAITGGAFVPDGIWPSAYDGSYLYEDFICATIFLLTQNASGQYIASEFATGASYPIDMSFGPHGSTQALYYLQNGPPQLRRIAFTGGANRSPVAVADASPTSGDLPLTVQFDGTESSDPDQQQLSFDWDFGDGSAHATTATASHQYTTAGTYTAKLTVSDGNGGQDTATIRIDAGNNAPAPSISTPALDQLFRVGETIALTGAATDPEDGSLPDSSLTWQVVKHHATHTHPFLPPTAGNGVSITTPIPEDFSATTNSYLEVKLTATDSQGLSTTVTRDLRPRLVDLSFATDPPGFEIDLNGAPAPASLTSWDGWTLQLSTSAAQSDSQGQGHTFVSWSDGGALSHPITTPPTDTTYTALFTRNYARPRGATPTRVPLVPAQRPCVLPTSVHGPPLLHPSCSPVRRFSTDATIGTPEANGLPARSIGYVRFRTVVGDPDTPADEADVRITAYIPDVFDENLFDYVGDLRARTRIRLTDRQHGPSVAETGTVEDFTLNFFVPCTGTPDTSGSACSTQTTGDALIPGLVGESARAIWDLGPVRLYDHGPDGTIATADDALFATQGLFVP
jgi:glucose/arabinose dehydrogenase/PKD repeat protein